MKKTNPALSSMIEIDLMNFNDPRIEETGELSILPTFEDDIYVKLGADLLSISRISDPTRNDGANGYSEARNLYIVRNTLKQEAEPVVVSDGAVDLGVSRVEGLRDLSLSTRPALIIGREATPSLGLSDSASAEHFMMRIGGMSGSLHFSDRHSATGTSVHVSSRDSRLITEARRSYRVHGGQFITERALEGRWLQ